MYHDDSLCSCLSLYMTLYMTLCLPRGHDCISGQIRFVIPGLKRMATLALLIDVGAVVLVLICRISVQRDT